MYETTRTFRTSIISVMLVLALASVANAFPSACGDSVGIQENCTMFSPIITCASYTYKVFNATGNHSGGTLTQVNGSIYRFTFNASTSVGGYVVELCDGSTREITVRGDNNDMVAVAIAILLVSILAFVLYVQRSFEGEAKEFTEWIRHMLTVFGFGMMPVIFHVAKEFSTAQGYSASIQIVLDTMFNVSVTVLIAIMFFYLFMLFRLLYKTFINSSKKRKGEED